ncbi:hypothetical protein Bca101_071373 [Brassica carinata]
MKRGGLETRGVRFKEKTIGRVNGPDGPVLRSELIRNAKWLRPVTTPSTSILPRDTAATHVELASKCITSPFRSDVGCWFDEALRTQAVLLEAGFLNIFGQCQVLQTPERCLYGPGKLEIEVSGSSSLCGWLLMYRASVVSVFPCEEGCCVDELWRLDNALRSRSGKTEQRHRVHFTFKRSHWSMHSTWKLWAQGKEMFSTSCPIWSSSKQIKHSPQSSGTAFNLNFGSSQQNDKTCLSRSQVKSRMDEPIDKSKHWGDLEEEEQEEEMDEEELEDDMESVDTLSRYCFALNSEHSNWHRDTESGPVLRKAG